MTRRLTLAIAVVATAAGLHSAAAEAAWQAGGSSSSAYTKARTIGAQSAPSASVSGRNVTVTWTAPTGGVPVDYTVKRYANGGGVQTIGANCSGTQIGLSCTENDVAPGSWQYTVTPSKQNWNVAESVKSSAVTVGSPSLSLSTTNFTVLQATTSGQIQNFKGGQTVTYRLDNPTTGTVLAGSITPSPVPANGTATVSVTIPSGISNGAHTVYAIGSTGDQASAAITVNTGSGFFATGSYTGNGGDNRGFTGLGFNPQVVIVKAVTNQIGVVRTDTMNGDASKPMTGGTAFVTDRIQSLDSDGFTIGTNPQVNSNTVSYRWMAFRAQAGLLRTGSYTGNGTGLSPTGIGFSPEHVGVFSAEANAPHQRYSGMASSFTYGSDTGSSTAITALGADGFTVGNSATVNQNGVANHYVATNDVAGIADVNSYTGNGADNRNITGVGLSPAYVSLRANDTVTARTASHRPSSLTGDATMLFTGTANAADYIQAIQGDGFQVGTNAAVNNSGTVYHYLAVKNASPSSSCSSPGSQTVTATRDSYVLQDSPSANNGTSSDLYVQSKGGSANRRTLVGFQLPTIPSGCSLSQATLSLHSTSAVNGRTIDAYRAGGNWTETGVTWANAPATAGAATGVASGTGRRSWDVTSQTSTMYSGANDGFILRDSAENAAGAGSAQTYQSRQGSPDAQDPSLYVAWN